jgi:hypothetical protein
VKLLKIILLFYKDLARRYFVDNPESELFSFFVVNLIGEKYFGDLLNNSEKHQRSIARSWRLLNKDSKYYLPFFNSLISKQIYKIKLKFKN